MPPTADAPRHPLATFLRVLTQYVLICNVSARLIPKASRFNISEKKIYTWYYSCFFFVSCTFLHLIDMFLKMLTACTSNQCPLCKLHILRIFIVKKIVDKESIEKCAMFYRKWYPLFKKDRNNKQEYFSKPVIFDRCVEYYINRQ